MQAITHTAVQAVITGDIVNSTGLDRAKENQLLKSLNRLFASDKYEFYRGDSFQVFQQDAGGALRTALCCRAAAIGISTESSTALSDVRISIGIGRTKTPTTGLGTSKGEAFLLSGRAFDNIAKTSKRLAITAAQPLANEALKVIAAYADVLFQAMTPKQAEVIFELIGGATQQDAAVKLGKSKSTINQHASAGRWAEIEGLLGHYANIIKEIT